MDGKISEISSDCIIQPWNKVDTESVTSSVWNTFSHWLWLKLDLSRENLQNYTETSILAAYVYQNHISMTLISQYLVRTEMYCRYYDCQRKEIPGSSWRGIVFPESVVHCPRRIGAEFVSISENSTGIAPMPVRLTYRIYEEPVHELAVCVAPLYGNESSWLPIVDFVEHNKLEGASFFYFYVGEVSPYDQRILDDYSRTGDLEIIKMQDKFHRVFIGWQFLQVQDCHLRSKYHSRWTAFIDLDERIQTFGQRMIDLLRSIQDPAIGEVQILNADFIKDQDYPKKFENLEQLEREFIFEKYINSSVHFPVSKAIIRSEKIGIMSVHYAVAKYPGVQTLQLNQTQAIRRHLRSTKYRIYNSNWHNSTINGGKPFVFNESPLPQKFREEMRKAVTQRVLHVYDRVPLNCSAVPQKLIQMIHHPDPCDYPWPSF